MTLLFRGIYSDCISSPVSLWAVLLQTTSSASKKMRLHIPASSTTITDATRTARTRYATHTHTRIVSMLYAWIWLYSMLMLFLCSFIHQLFWPSLKKDFPFIQVVVYTGLPMSGLMSGSETSSGYLCFHHEVSTVCLLPDVFAAKDQYNLEGIIMMTRLKLEINEQLISKHETT